MSPYRHDNCCLDRKLTKCSFKVLYNLPPAQNIGFPDTYRLSFRNLRQYLLLDSNGCVNWKLRVYCTRIFILWTFHTSCRAHYNFVNVNVLHSGGNKKDSFLIKIYLSDNPTRTSIKKRQSITLTLFFQCRKFQWGWFKGVSTCACRLDCTIALQPLSHITEYTLRVRLVGRVCAGLWWRFGQCP